MSKVHGAKSKLWLAQYDVSGFSNDIAPSMTREPVDVTAQGQVAPVVKTFIPGLLTWKFTEKGFWDYALGTPDDVMNALFGTQAQLVYSPPGANPGDVAYGGYSAPFTQYDIMSPLNGAIAFQLAVTGNDKLSRCKVLGNKTATAGENGNAQDLGAAGTAGVESFLAVTAFTGTSATIKVQSSADGSTGWADRVTHTAVTTPTAERLLAGTTTDRYLRYVLSGTITSISFIVIARNVGVELWN